MSEDQTPRSGATPFNNIMRIPVTLEIVLGTARMPISELMKLGRDSVVPLDRKIGEPVDVVVNGRVIARGEVVVLDNEPDRLGVSLTEVSGAGAADLPSAAG